MFLHKVSLLPIITFTIITLLFSIITSLLHHYYVIITTSLLPVITLTLLRIITLLLRHYYLNIMSLLESGHLCNNEFIITHYYISMFSLFCHYYLLLPLLPIITYLGLGNLQMLYS